AQTNSPRYAMTYMNLDIMATLDAEFSDDIPF
ncbi:unnamed protein product, partial [marine sediment metagenome]